MNEHATCDQVDVTNRQRVVTNIARYVVEFWQQRVVDTDHAEFHDDDLVNYVREHHPATSPASASRILRELRRRGSINYEIVCRRDSLYRALPLKERACP